MFAVLLLILVACSLGVGAGLLTALAIWLALIFKALGLLVQQVPRGMMLFIRLAMWLTVRSAKVCRYVWQSAKHVGLWGAQNACVWLFVGSYRLREWYVSSELKRRGA